MYEKKEIAGRIRNWLKQEKMFRKKLTDDKAYFNFQAEYQDIPFHVLQPKDREDLILVICDLILDDKQKEMVRTLQAEEQTKVLREMQYQTSTIKGQFHVILDKEKYLEKIRLWDTIYYDGLSKDRLIKIIFETIKSFLLVEELLTRIFNLPEMVEFEKRQIKPPSSMYA